MSVPSQRPAAPPAVAQRAADSGGSPLPIAQPATAVLVDTRNGQWAGQTLKAGEPLAVGRPWKLQSGLAEIEFACGARIVLQAPATIEVRSAISVMLQQGRVTARMTRKTGEKFVVHTPRADVVDLGTEFGVDVDSQFNAAVEVFSGEVELSPLDARQPLRLKTNEAAQFDSRAGTAMVVDPNGLPHFIKSLPPISGVISESLIEHLDAGEGAVLDARSGAVVRWNNLATSGGDSVAQRNPALRPVFVAKAAAGRPAVAFSGGKALLGSNPDAFRFTQGVSWFVVAEPGSPPGNNPRKNFFFGTLTSVPEQWLGIAAGFDEARCPFAFVRPATGVARDDEGQYVLSPEVVDRPVLLACRLDPSDCTAVLYVNGDEAARQTNPYWGTRLDGGLLAVGCGRAGEYSETFRGRISEILIYDRLLTDEEWIAVEKHLKSKYKLN